MATQRLGQFDLDITRARDLVALGQGISGVTAGRVDNADLNRFALAQAVGAMDSYVHGVVLDRAVDLLMGRLAVQPSESKIGLHFGAVQNVITAASPAAQELAAMSHIAQRLSRETFQRPNAIGAAFAMVGIPSVWKAAFPTGAKKQMESVGLIVARRNRIVHECDNDLLSPGSLTPLSITDVQNAISTIEETFTQIDQLC